METFKNVIIDTPNYIHSQFFKYENLLSTMPIDILCSKITPSLGADVLEATKKLKHSSSHIVGLGLKGQAPEFLRTKSWAYFSEANCPFYRVTIFLPA